MPHRSFLRAHAVLIVFITLLTVGGAAVAVTSQQPKYEATASVLVRSERLPKGGVQAPDMVTEKQIALSGSVARRAADLLSSPSGYLGAGTYVAVLDTGVNYNYADFGSCASGPGAAGCRVTYAADTTTTIPLNHRISHAASIGHRAP